jgi:multiple sugar transport system permease protein
MATTTATEAAPSRLRTTMAGARLREAGWGYGFALVPLAVFGLFFVYPFVYAVYISFYHWGIAGKTSPGTGTFNYAKVLHDPIFHTALRNIAEYTVAVVPLEMALGLSLALVINQKLRGRNFFRSAFYFPSIASSVAITTIVLFIFSQNGLFNHIFGLDKDWFGQASTVGWGIVGMNAWTTSGTVMIFYLASLQAIPDDVYEAAALDNTGAWRTFWKITFPCSSRRTSSASSSSASGRSSCSTSRSSSPAAPPATRPTRRCIPSSTSITPHSGSSTSASPRQPASSTSSSSSV